MTNWTTDKPTEPGRYRMRVRVFGWKVDVQVFSTLSSGGGVLFARPLKDDGSPDLDAGYVSVNDIGHWVEWRKK